MSKKLSNIVKCLILPIAAVSYTHLSIVIHMSQHPIVCWNASRTAAILGRTTYLLITAVGRGEWISIYPIRPDADLLESNMMKESMEGLQKIIPLGCPQVWYP